MINQFNNELKHKKIERAKEDLYILNHLIKSNIFNKWSIFTKENNKNPLIKTDVIYNIPYKNTNKYIIYRRKFISNKTERMKIHLFNCNTCMNNVRNIIKIEDEKLILYKKKYCRVCYLNI